jgi:hypothetical protein
VDVTSGMRNCDVWTIKALSEKDGERLTMPRVSLKQMFAITILVAVGLAVLPWSRTAYVSQIPGHPGQNVEFIQRGFIIESKPAVYIRFPNGAEIKLPVIKSGIVTADDIRRTARVSYDGNTLRVFGPQGEVCSVPGYAF